MSGSPSVRYLFEHFTKPHPTYKVIPNKAIGVALIELPLQFDAFLKGSRMMDMRNKRNRALKLGYEFKPFTSLDFRDDIVAINQSAEQRDGREMPVDYLDPRLVDDYLSSHKNFYGVFDRNHHLQAYIHAEHLGEICVICRILGHKDFLKDGIMYLLISELVKELVASSPDTRYLMYDTVLGANPGLRYFKDRSGFVPFRITWKWESIP